MDSFKQFTAGVYDSNSPVSLLNRDILELIIAAWRKYELRSPDLIKDNKKMWLKDNLLHRDFDLPAFVTDDENSWYQNGLRHRKNNPAQIFKDGSENWFYNGEFHREDGPAVKTTQIFSNRSLNNARVAMPINNDRLIWEAEQWYLHGVLHRIGGPAFTNIQKLEKRLSSNSTHVIVIEVYKKEVWFENDEYHREDGPAVICWSRRMPSENRQEWWNKGILQKTVNTTLP